MGYSPWGLKRVRHDLATKQQQQQMEEATLDLKNIKTEIKSILEGNAKEWSNYRTIAPISHASKVMLKIRQARLQQYMNWELPDV